MRAYKQSWVDFTAVPNEIFKHGLSLKALGLYLYIANKPDGWDFSINGTASQLSDGRASVRTAIADLEKAGFLKRVQVRKSDGSFGESIWYIYGKPVENTVSEKQVSEKSLQVKTKGVRTKREGGKLSPTEVEGLCKKYNITLKALQKVHAKYLGWCDLNSKKPSKLHFINNILPTQHWEIGDLTGDGLLSRVGGLE